jgi:hypothetical protein
MTLDQSESRCCCWRCCNSATSWGGSEVSMTIGAGVGIEIWSAERVCPQGRVSGRCRNGLNSPGSDGQKSLDVSFVKYN